MELHQIRYFVAVAESGSFTRAANRCFVSQPSLSQQISKLEDEFGQPLFDRLGRRVELTEGGRRFLDRARSILFEIEDAVRAVRDDGTSGRVRLGVLPSIAPYLLPDVLARAHQLLPAVRITIHEDFRSHLLEEISAGRLDVFLGSLPPEKPDMEVEHLFSEDLVVAFSTSHPLASVDRVGARDLNGQKLILLGESSSLGLQTKRFFGAHQIDLEVVAQCAQVQSVKALVATGLGIAIIPRMAIDGTEANMAFRAIDGVRAIREIVLVRHRHRFRGRAEMAFVEMLREQCAARFLKGRLEGEAADD